MGERTLQDLQMKQALPLSVKVLLTKDRIRQWVNEFGEDGVHVSFSGGKDSTVLLHLVREMYPDVEGVFVDTGLEYPEIREFVKTFDNIIWLKPKMNFRKVIEKYGYPFISKEVSQKVCEYLQKPDGYAIKYFIPEEEGGKKSPYNMTKWKYLLECPYPISNKCCNVMKKRPVEQYNKQTGRVAITAQMASESMLRTTQWLKHGCNAFDAKKKVSNPMSFWTEQDVLLYIYQNHLPICSVYGDIVKDNDVDGQTDWEDLGLFDIGVPVLRTTGCKRTGCMFCGFGCHMEKPGEGRFEKMKVTHPKQYEWIMKPWDEGGLGYKDVIDWINEHNGKGTIIRY